MKPDFQAIESKLSKLFAEFEGQLPADQLQDMKDLSMAGEPGVSFENFCTQLYEFDIGVSATQRQSFAEIGNEIGINSKYWERLALRNS